MVFLLYDSRELEGEVRTLAASGCLRWGPSWLARNAIKPISLVEIQLSSEGCRSTHPMRLYALPNFIKRQKKLSSPSDDPLWNIQGWDQWGLFLSSPFQDPGPIEDRTGFTPGLKLILLAACTAINPSSSDQGSVLQSILGVTVQMLNRSSSPGTSKRPQDSFPIHHVRIALLIR